MMAAGRVDGKLTLKRLSLLPTYLRSNRALHPYNRIHLQNNNNNDDRNINEYNMNI